MIWSAKDRVLRWAFAVLAIVGGSLFTFAYLLVASVRSRGDMRSVLLVRHFQP